MHTPLEITVIVPVYNGVEYVLDSLSSIISQSRAADEILIIDDGSTDGLLNYLSDFIDAHHIVKYIYQENTGVSGARNRGILESKSNFVAFLDSDDQWAPGFLEDVANVIIDGKNIDFIFSDFIEKTLLNEEVYFKKRDLLIKYKDKVDSKNNNYYYFSHNLLPIAINAQVFPSTITAVVKKEKLIEVGLFDTSLNIAEDLDLWVKLLYVSNVAFIDKVNATYVRRDGSLDANMNYYHDRKTVLFRMRDNNTYDFSDNTLNDLDLLLRDYYFVMGNYYLRERSIRLARDNYFSALKYNLFDANILLCIFKTFIPKVIFDNLKILFKNA